MDPQVLIAAADDDLRASLRDLLASHPLEVTAPRPLDFLTRLACSSVRVLILVLTAGGGLDLLDAARERRPDVPVLVLRANATVAEATEAMRRGAEDFLPIPYVAEALRKEVARIVEAVEMRDSLSALHDLVADTFGFDRILSRSACMRPVFERALAASRNDTPVLIVGETGTGKELIARAIHANGRRASRPFVPVNCAALPRDLFESELFGHRRGAFSGAHADYPGLFVSAHGGTLFLDEIGELPIDMQGKFLRVLEERKFRRLGGKSEVEVDVRVICATNRDLKEEIKKGRFREDLYFRLHVFTIHLPPLKERREDVPLLVQHFIEKFNGETGKHVQAVSAGAMSVLQNYAWPGNIRELRNTVERAMILTDGDTITEEHLPPDMRPSRPEAATLRVALGVQLREIEKEYILASLQRNGGNKARTARLLGMSRRTIYRKMDELKITNDKHSSFLSTDAVMRQGVRCL